MFYIFEFGISRFLRVSDIAANIRRIKNILNVSSNVLNKVPLTFCNSQGLLAL